jgi:hypothetical protein
MKLIAQVAAGVTLAVLVLWLLVGLAVKSGNSAKSAAPSCNGSAVMTAASAKLAYWLNQKVGKDNVYHVHGTFVVEISTSVTAGSLQGTQNCMAVASVGISQAGGTPLVASQTFNVHFLLATGQDGTSQITLDEGNLLSNGGAFDTAGSLLMQKAQGEQSTAQEQATSAAGANVANAPPTITGYAKCSGILILAAAFAKSDDPPKSHQYLKDAETLETKASKLKGFDQGTYMEMAFDTEGVYPKMLNSGAATPTDFWSDAGYCRGLAQ